MKEKSRTNSHIVESLEAVARRGIPSWLELDKDAFKATVKALPNREEITMPTDNCVIRYECVNCKAIITPKKGDCCIFCSYGDVPCPPEQDVS